MRSTRENRFALFLLLLVSACTYRPESSLVQGNWKYTSIQKNGETFAEVSDDDFLRLHPDSTFEYNILSLNKQMKGRWSYSGHTLHLQYADPDTLRHFEALILSNYQLKLKEGDMEFSFDRVE